MFIRFTPEGKGAFGEYSLNKQKMDPPFLTGDEKWVDSVFNSFSTEDKIAQLFMIAAYPNHNYTHYKEVEYLIKKYNVGGLIFFQGNPVKEAKLINRYQEAASTPLLIAIDAEWGLAMRIDSTIHYPYQMMLGAIQNDRLIYDMGVNLALQMKRMGIHVNFAPVVDVNNNAQNPVINSRSFGEDKTNVARKGILYMKGMQDNNIIAVAKHFPGHGDTDVDSHLSLPVISHSRQRLDNIELFPFKEIINSGISGIMVAHLNVPALDPTPDLASTLSPLIIDSLLKNNLDFKGLVFTDAMNMGGIINHYKPGEANIKAILAGNDVLLMPGDVPKAISAIKKEIRKGNISQDEIDRRCKKILKAKCWVGLNKYKPVDLNDITKDLNDPGYRLHNQRLIEKSITLLQNKNDLIPLKRLDTVKIASVTIGDQENNSFYETLNKYIAIDKFWVPKNADNKKFNDLFPSLSEYNIIVVGIHETNMFVSKNYGITDQTIDFVDSLVTVNNVILDVFANPYSLAFFKNLKYASGLILSYEDNELTRKMSAQLLFGAIPARGLLPVTASTEYPVRSGILTKKIDRLKYSIPLEAGIDENKLIKIDSIVFDAIKEKATPGCQVMAIKDGIVFYQKSFGYHTYREKNPVKNTDLYDLASITKIAASMPAIMRLHETKLFDIDENISKYLPYLDTTNKKDIIIKDILLHQSRLKAWIPFYMNTIEPMIPGQDFARTSYSASFPLQLGKSYYVNKHLKYKDNYYAREASEEYPVQVAENLYMNRSFVDSIYNIIASSELNGKNGYRYSDLGFYLFYKIIENLTGKDFPSYLDSSFYSTLGASSVCFNPLQQYSKKEIAPTENDLVFRRQLVHGHVHDPGAAMLGGVCGHAGLFANANDLAKIMQMFLNKGHYGDIKYFDKKTIDYFTTCPDCENGNRRGIGFDKPQPDTTKNGPTCKSASLSSFGHTGFTGTISWADPEYNLVYIFLSNRAYPDALNNKLLEMDVRTNIQEVLYESIMKK
jgi:beta-glucosidase-like glycosyl hydrolase/CubicO group peptidase (beta-lactamase class C family)